MLTTITKYLQNGDEIAVYRNAVCWVKHPSKAIALLFLTYVVRVAAFLG
ncbi:hypothetical protein H6G27_17170 [Nostoc linckia FACHB-104]|nr:hypothetical protein [Nostoc linckia FACHB-104]